MKSIDADIALTAVSYQALADAQVSLLDIASQVSAFDPGQVLTVPVTVGRLFEVMVEALPETRMQSTCSTPRPWRSYDAGLKAQTIRLGDIVTVAGDAGAALAAKVNVLDLVQGAVFAANGENTIAVPGLTATVPDLTDVEVEASVVQKPQIGCGLGSLPETHRSRCVWAVTWTPTSGCCSPTWADVSK